MEPHSERNRKSSSAESSDEFFVSTSTKSDNDKYGYNPYLFHFNNELIQQRYTKYRCQQKFNAFGFFMIGLFYLGTAGIVTQWRAINGSIGLLWMIQGLSCLICVVICYPLIFIIEYRRRWIDRFCEIFYPTANIRQLVSSLRMKTIYAHVILHAITHLALVGRSYKLCSTADMQSTFDIVYCNGSETDIPNENFFSMIVLCIIYHYIYLHLLPWAIPASTFVIGMIFTIMTIAHKRIHMETLGKSINRMLEMVRCKASMLFTQHNPSSNPNLILNPLGLTLQQKNFHVLLLFVQLATLTAHFQMQNYAVNSFITQDRAEGLIYKYPCSHLLLLYCGMIEFHLTSLIKHLLFPPMIGFFFMKSASENTPRSVHHYADDDDDDAMTDISSTTVSSMTLRSKQINKQERDARIVHAHQKIHTSLYLQERIIAKPLLQPVIVTERPLSEVDGDDDFDMNLSFDNTIQTPQTSQSMT